MRVLLDEMYPARLAAGLRAVGIEASTVAEFGLAGGADAEVFAAAVAGGHVVLTENVGDFTRLAAEHNAAGGHHHGLLIALSSRFSRQPAGAATLIAAVKDAAEESFDDRVIYLKATGPR